MLHDNNIVIKHHEVLVLCGDYSVKYYIDPSKTTKLEQLLSEHIIIIFHYTRL